MNSPVYLISGHDDITAEEFEINYEYIIRKTNAEYDQCKYIVGDRKGCDQLTQDFLRSIGVSPERITIYYDEDCDPPINKFTYNVIKLNCVQLYKSMVMNSVYDIMWLRDDHQQSVPHKIVALRKEKINMRKLLYPRPTLCSIYIPINIQL